MSDDVLMQSIERARERQKQFAYGSENWLWVQRDIDRMEEEAAKREIDERFRLRTWG